MIADRLVADATISPESGEDDGCPLNSSQLLLELVTFAEAKRANDRAIASSPLSGVVSLAVLRSLLSALHYRDAATVQHSRRVAMLSVGMAHFLGWEPTQQKVLEVAALLHDVGKIGVPDNILFKPSRLSPDEAELMALHHNIGVDVLQACRIDHQVTEIVAQSRIAYSDLEGCAPGAGRLSAASHQGARILSVADAYDSLATDKNYRPAKPHPEIMKVLTESAGTQFDGNVVRTLARWIDSEGLPFTPGHLDPGAAGSPRNSADPNEAREANALGNIFSYLYLLESLYDGFYLVDSDLKFVVWNRGCERLFGLPAAQMLGQPWTARAVGFADELGNRQSEEGCALPRVISEGKPTTSNEQIMRADGTSLVVELQSVPLFDSEGRLQGVAEIIRDLARSSRRPQEYRALKLAASRDALTSVANRGELEAQLATLIETYEKPPHELFSVIFLDIDFFKNINDTFGHTVGDEVLIDVARLLQHETYSGEIVARYGGEEFVILCPGTDLEQGVNRAERLRAAIPRAQAERMGEYKVTASFGVTQVEPHDTVERILRRADRALYNAKESGRNRTCSLTEDEMAASEHSATAPEVEDEDEDKFVFSATFQAFVAADMIIYKLGGFVSDHQAKLLSVSPGRAIIRVGKSGLLPYWGRHDAKRPVEMTLDFGEPTQISSKGPLSASKQLTVHVEIRPQGWVSDPDIFQARARRVLKLLRSFFAAT